MIHKTGTLLFTITLFLCTPTTHAMHQRKGALSSASATSSTILTTPASSSSPYNELQQLALQEATAKKKLKQKNTEFYNTRCLGCLTNETAGHCAGVAGLTGILSFFPHARCPGMMTECESACGLPQGSAFIGSFIIAASSAACLMLGDFAHEKAVKAEELELFEIRSKREQVESKIRTGEASKWERHKRKVKKAD